MNIAWLSCRGVVAELPPYTNDNIIYTLRLDYIGNWLGLELFNQIKHFFFSCKVKSISDFSVVLMQSP